MQILGHSIKGIMNNTPTAITVNDLTTEALTNGGNVYQAGFINGKIKSCFSEAITNENIVGKIIDIKATESKIYILNDAGSVFDYSYNHNCTSVFRDVYSPVACGGDNAIKIDTGRAHVVILTKAGKVWGAGDNSQYQLVPQGQCKYDTAVEIIVTDTNLHDNKSCTAFTGVYNELEHPIIPACETTCNRVSCLKNELCDVLLGYIYVPGVTISCEHTGILSVPVYGNLHYVAFLCVDKKNCVSGQITYTINKIYIKCGCTVGKISYSDDCGCHTTEFNLSSTSEIILFEAESACAAPRSDLCGFSGRLPITRTTQITGKCGSCIIVNIDALPEIKLPTAEFDCHCNTIILEHCKCRTVLHILCDGKFEDMSDCEHVSIGLDFDVPLDCCKPYVAPKHEVILPQPCWANIYAGYDISVLVDNCNRLYAFGSLYQVRSNKDLLKRSCLEDLLNKTHTSISFPADQLNCGNRVVNNDKCGKGKACSKKFKTDLGKFGINVSFPSGDDECHHGINVCDFLSQFKSCNENAECEPTCEPCDGYIYLDVDGNRCDCACPIGSITLFNKKSICKFVSQECPDLITLQIETSSIVEFDLNKYCVDAVDVPLEKIIKLELCREGPNVNLYIDVDTPGGIRFCNDEKKHNVEFTINASTRNHQFLLNFGSILDPVELTNLKYSLALDGHYPCPKFKNPFDTKLTNTYVRGGDYIKFVHNNPKNIRQAITADIPTVFRLDRRVISVGVGCNNLTVLVGGLACPNEVFVIGSNCYGELGIGSNESVVCWRQINRCLFEGSQVTDIFSGCNVTFYATQTNSIYGSGHWKSFVNSNKPVLIKSICSAWRIRKMAIAKNHIVMLGADGSPFGLGDNSLGELGLEHVNRVCKPTPLVFFYRLNNVVAKQLTDGLNSHCSYRNCGDSDDDCCERKNDCGEKKYKCGRFSPENNRKSYGKKYNPNGRLYVNKYNKY